MDYFRRFLHQDMDFVLKDRSVYYGTLNKVIGNNLLIYAREKLIRTPMKNGILHITEPVRQIVKLSALEIHFIKEKKTEITESGPVTIHRNIFIHLQSEEELHFYCRRSSDHTPWVKKPFNAKFSSHETHVYKPAIDVCIGGKTNANNTFEETSFGARAGQPLTEASFQRKPMVNTTGEGASPQKPFRRDLSVKFNYKPPERSVNVTPESTSMSSAGPSTSVLKNNPTSPGPSTSSSTGPDKWDQFPFPVWKKH